MGELVRCPDCDLLQRGPELAHGESARCPRCDAQLYRERHNTIERTLAITLGALLLWIVANAYPFMTFEFKGTSQDNQIITGFHHKGDEGGDTGSHHWFPNLFHRGD